MAEQTYKWRDRVRVHPSAEEYPLIEGDEFEAFRKDIRDNGLEDKVQVFRDEDGDHLVVWDGRNRCNALEANGKEPFGEDGQHDPEWVEIVEKPANVAIKTNSKNRWRRQMTTRQKRDVVERALKADPALSNKAIARALGVDDKTVAKGRAKLEDASEIPKSDERLSADGRKRPATRAPAKSPAAPKAEPLKETKEQKQKRLAKEKQDDAELIAATVVYDVRKLKRVSAHLGAKGLVNVTKARTMLAEIDPTSTMK
jgi:hypothetical protein